MCKLCVSCGSVRGNPSVSGCTVCTESGICFPPFLHFCPHSNTFTLSCFQQQDMTLHTIIGRHSTWWLWSEQFWAGGGLVCATAVVVRQWTPSVLHGPSDLSATPIIALLHRSNDPSLLLHLHLVSALTLHTSYLPWLLQTQILRLKILHTKYILEGRLVF